jgi:hypothetical protein
MATTQKASKTVFKIIDAMNAPYRGRVLRLRLQEGSAASVKELRSARFRARSPQGEEESLQVLGFALLGGRPSDTRLTRTGRVDLVVELEGKDARPNTAVGWELTGPL